MTTSSSPPATMRAWTVTRKGLALDAHRPAPTAEALSKGNHLLLRVRHAGLNPADLALMNVIPSWLPWRRNPVAGLDFVGEVLAFGPGAPPALAKTGTLVCGALGVRQAFFGAGTLGEVLAVPAELVAVVPRALLGAPRGAVGMGVTGQTAALVMREAEAKGVGQVTRWEGTRVLVHGASGGVGSILVQVAKARGAYVVGVCSGANAEMVSRLGADKVRLFLPLRTCNCLPAGGEIQRCILSNARDAHR